MPAATSVMITAYHEAGHAVVAIALGTPIKRATLHAVTTMVRVGCPRAQRNEAVISLAGAEAETKYCGYSMDRQAQLWGDADAWATDLANTLRNLAGADIEPAVLEARQLVNEHWDLIELLAQALHNHGELTGAEIDAVIGCRHKP